MSVYRAICTLLSATLMPKRVMQALHMVGVNVADDDAARIGGVGVNQAATQGAAHCARADNADTLALQQGSGASARLPPAERLRVTEFQERRFRCSSSGVSVFSGGRRDMGLGAQGPMVSGIRLSRAFPFCLLYLCNADA